MTIMTLLRPHLWGRKTTTSRPQSLPEKREGIDEFGAVGANPDGVKSDGGFSILDGAAIVAGGAVAAVHIRGAIDTTGLGLGWVLLWGTFFWVALTAAGPFLYLVRRYLRRVDGYPRVGDRLWAMLGLPWLLTVLFQSGRGLGEHHANELLAAGLSVGLLTVSVIALGVVWATWVMVSPRQAAANFSGPWTNRIGLILAVAWPVQCGVGMVVIG